MSAAVAAAVAAPVSVLDAGALDGAVFASSFAAAGLSAVAVGSVLPQATAAGSAHTGNTAPPATRMVRVRQSATPVPARIYQRAALPLETDLDGPAIIEQLDTTTLVEPGWTARASANGSLLITRKASA